MAITAYGKGLCNNAYKTAMTAATTVTIKVYDGAGTPNLLHTYTINAAASTVDGGTGVLTLVEGTPVTSVASGIASFARFYIDANIVEDLIPVAAGASSIPGSLIVSSTTYVSGVGSQLLSAQFG